MSTDIQKDSSHLYAQWNGISKHVEAWLTQYQVKRSVMMGGLDEGLSEMRSRCRGSHGILADAAAPALHQRYTFFFSSRVLTFTLNNPLCNSLTFRCVSPLASVHFIHSWVPQIGCSPSRVPRLRHCATCKQTGGDVCMPCYRPAVHF